MARPRAITPAEADLLTDPTLVSVQSTRVVKRNKFEEEEISKVKIYVIESGGGIVFRIPQTEFSVFDEEKGFNRAIRYCPNERSIFVDEQQKDALREQVVFYEGQLIVGPERKNLQDYLDRHPINIANGGGIFRVLENDKKSAKEVEDEFTKLDAVILVRDKSIDELLPVAMSLGINTNQKNIEIKRELLQEAKANPVKFMELFDSPAVKARAIVMQCVDFQIINPKPDGMYWYDSNRLIIASPAGQDTVEVMTRFCLTDKGSIVFNELQEQLDRM
jgi:hypothetical protein